MLAVHHRQKLALRRQPRRSPGHAPSPSPSSDHVRKSLGQSAACCHPWTRPRSRRPDPARPRATRGHTEEKYFPLDVDISHAPSARRRIRTCRRPPTTSPMVLQKSRARLRGEWQAARDFSRRLVPPAAASSSIEVPPMTISDSRGPARTEWDSTVSLRLNPQFLMYQHSTQCRGPSS